MINKYKKLVAVAEDMAAVWNEAGNDVSGIKVCMEDNTGTVSLGEWCVVGRYYSSDDNVVFPEYGIGYKMYHFTWVDDAWVEDKPEIVERIHVQEDEEEWDELPF
jgi:hypothetical protein